MRIVLDTNVAIVGLLWRGNPNELLGLAMAGNLRCFATEALIAELTRVLGYARFAKRIELVGTSIEQLVADYRQIARIVPAAEVTPTVIADPDDDQVLACAIAAGAGLIVSGNAHLLNLKRYHEAEIISPGNAISRAATSP